MEQNCGVTMDYNTARDNLTQEFIHRYKLFFWLLKAGGFSRVAVKNNELVEKSITVSLYAIIPFIVTNCSFLYMLNAFHENGIQVLETLPILQLVIMFNSLIFNITFFHMRCGSKLILKCIDIDCRIGAEDTKFLRDLENRFCNVLILFILIVIIIVSVIVDIAFYIPQSLYLSNFFCFILLSFPYCDYIYMLRYHLFMSLRMQYLNVALQKVTRMKSEYLVDNFGSSFWKQSHDDLVKFHERAEPEEIYNIMRILVNLKHYSMKVDNFSLLINTVCLILSHFIEIQELILYIKMKEITMIMMVRFVCTTVWFVSNWALCLGITMLTGKFYKQTLQTTLICNFAQLKSSTTMRLLKLTKRILSMLEMHDIRTRVYGIYIVDNGLLLRVTAAIFVYVTMQLQLSFPSQKKLETD